MSDTTPPEGQPVPPQDPPAPYPGQYPPPPSMGQPAPQPAYPQPPYGQPAYGAWTPPTGDPDKRPATVTAAAVVTWISTTLALIATLVLFGLAVADNDSFFDSLMEDVDDVSRADIRLFVIIGAVVLGVWALAAMALAVLAFRRHNWARIALVVSAVVAAPFLLLTVVAIVPGFLLIAVVATVVLLFTGGANEWYRAKSLPPPVYGGPTYS